MPERPEEALDGRPLDPNILGARTVLSIYGEVFAVSDGSAAIVAAVADAFLVCVAAPSDVEASRLVHDATTKKAIDKRLPITQAIRQLLGLPLVS
jgi:hypothetical protein